MYPTPYPHYSYSIPDYEGYYQRVNDNYLLGEIQRAINGEYTRSEGSDT